MKKRINKVTIKKQDELLEREGVFDLKDLLKITVVELIELIGESEIDSLLERMFINEFYGSDDFVNFGSIDLVDGHQYVLDIFEANDFNDNLEWFYKITIEDFLNLEDLRVNKIPFLTYYLKYFVQEGEMIEPEYLRYYDESSDSYTFYLDPEVIR
jgi:hypothetical protein